MPDLHTTLAEWLSGAREPPPVATLIGIRLLACEPGCCRMEMQAEPRHHNPMGTLHGGIVCDRADAAMGVTLVSSLNEGETFTTLELHINSLRPVVEGLLTATGHTVRRGKATGYVECEVVDAQGRPVAKASSTCLIQPVDPGS